MIQILRRHAGAATVSEETSRTRQPELYSSSTDPARSGTPRRPRHGSNGGSSHSRQSRRETNSRNISATTAATAHLLHMRLRGLGDTENMLQENAKLHDDCVICTEAFATNDVVCQLPCGHIHHSQCILKWLYHNHDTCPTCRQSVVKKNAFTCSADEERKEEDDYDAMLIRQQHKTVLQKHQNFDLIMRRVLRAQEDQRQLQHPESATTICYDVDDDDSDCSDNDVCFGKTIARQLNDGTLSPSFHHTQRLNCWDSSDSSSDWLMNDLEELLNV
ncbi:ring finger domain containing protein [Nitzschia inconspicua]|uniref:Ring finger domain containing protein n=1 Tax=Nitzschia inconspicua TaxID=303405 RepID=A0A9K3LIU4_9STRA|nr:ring finger domain containing protein [Nitzschia inconspicua]KAG7362433.1 ring finger domain containing protein [Nitzschia inconspicua]